MRLSRYSTARSLRCVVSFLLAFSLWAPSAHAQANFDVGRWLNRPDVKLVVVEFYATWCKPCMEAIPRWKKLHDTYRDKGLRLIVVNTRDPDAGCRALPWNPDKTLCDYDGVIDERFGVNGKLPSAFLWSWQGNLLAKNAHVDDIETAVKRYLDASPRVVIEVDAKTGAEALRSLVQSELTRAGKFTVLTSRGDQARLRRLRKASHHATRRDDQRCALGQEVSPNSVILAKRFRAGRSGERLSLSLQSIETGCVTQHISVPWNRRRAEASVAEGVTALLDKLRTAPRMPFGAAHNISATGEPRMPTNVPGEASLRLGRARHALLGRQANGGCQAQQFVGDYLLTTRVHAGKRASYVGVNGYYALEIQGSGCELDLSMTKVGFTNGGKVRELPEGKQLHGSTTIDISRAPVSVDLILERPDGSAAQSTRLYLSPYTLEGGRQGLQGTWRHMGSNWARAELRGSLVAQPNRFGYPPHSSLQGLSCQVQCDLVCDALHPDMAQIPDTRRRTSRCVRACSRRSFPSALTRCLF